MRHFPREVKKAKKEQFFFLFSFLPYVNFPKHQLEYQRKQFATEEEEKEFFLLFFEKA